MQCLTNSMWKRAFATWQELNTERRKLDIFWMVFVVHMLYFTFLLYCCYICSRVWYLTPSAEVFCLLLFSFLLRKCYDRYEICHKWPRICSVCRNHHHFRQPWRITGYATRTTQQVILVEQELPPFPYHSEFTHFIRVFALLDL